MIQWPCDSVVGISRVKTKLVECPVVDNVPVNTENRFMLIDPLECRGNYRTTSNDIKLVHWQLMGGLLTTFGTASRRLGGATVRPGPSSLYQM